MCTGKHGQALLSTVSLNSFLSLVYLIVLVVQKLNFAGRARGEYEGEKVT